MKYPQWFTMLTITIAQVAGLLSNVIIDSVLRGFWPLATDGPDWSGTVASQNASRGPPIAPNQRKSARHPKDASSKGERKRPRRFPD